MSDDVELSYTASRQSADNAMTLRQYGIPTPDEEALQEGAPSIARMAKEGTAALGRAGATVREQVIEPVSHVVSKTLGLDLPPGTSEELAGLASGLPSSAEVAESPTTSGVVTAIGMLPVVGAMRRFKPKMTPQEFERLVSASLAEGRSEIAQKIKTTLETTTAPMSDEVVRRKAAELRAAGGIDLDTAARLAPETPLNAAQSLAVAQVLTEHFQAWIPGARQALATNDLARQQEAILQFMQYLKPVAGFEGTRTEAGRALRVVDLTGSDIKDIRAAHANAMRLPTSATPAETLAALLAPFSDTTEFINTHVSKPYRDLLEGAQKAVSSNDPAAIQQSLFALEKAAGLPAEERTVIKQVLKEAEAKGQLTMFGGASGPTSLPLGPPSTIPEGTVEMRVKDINIQQAKESGFELRPDLRGTPRPTQQSLLDKPVKNVPAGTVEMIVREINDRLAKTKGFTLTGGMSRNRRPQQLDLELFPKILTEPPEQLAMSLAFNDPNVSREYLRLISKIRTAVEVGSDADVAKVYNQLRTKIGLDPKPPRPDPGIQKTIAQDEITALQLAFKRGAGGANVTPRDMLAALVADPELNPQRLAATIASMKGGWGDVAQWALINGMLSPVSDLKNLTATLTSTTWNTSAVRPMAGLLGRFFKEPGVAPGEGKELLVGAYGAFWDAVAVARKVMATGEGAFAADRLELRRLNPVTGANIARLLGNTATGPVLDATGPYGRAIDYLGHVFGVTGRLMLAGDEFLKAMAVQGEQYALAYRNAYHTAMKNDLSMREFKDLFAQTKETLRQDPALRKQAEEFALFTTLNNDLGGIGKAALKLREAGNQYTMIGGTVVAPFFRTLSNSVKQTGENTPLALLSNAVRRDMFGPDAAKRDLALAKWSTGTLFMSTMYGVAHAGYITGGGPSNPALRAQMERAGWKPYSFVLPDGTCVPIPEWMGVPGNLLKMAADMAEVSNYADDTEKEKLAEAIVSSYVGNLSFDFLRDTSNIFSAVAHGFRSKEDIDATAKMLGTLVPGGSLIRTGEQVAAAISGENLYTKDARTWIDKVRARMPGYDTLAKLYDLPPVPLRRDLYGEPVPPRSFFSAPRSDRFIDGLNAIGYAVHPPSRLYKRSPLTNEDYDLLQRRVGERIKAISTDPSVLLMLHSQGLTPKMRYDQIDAIISKAREAGIAQWQADLLGQPASNARMKKLKDYGLSVQ